MLAKQYNITIGPTENYSECGGMMLTYPLSVHLYILDEYRRKTNTSEKMRVP